MRPRPLLVPVGLRLAVRLLPRDAREEVLGDLLERWQAVRAVRSWVGQVAWVWRQPFEVFLVRLRLVPPTESGTPARPHVGTVAEVISDLGTAARFTIKRPGFSAAIILTMALGIGGTTAAFSLYHGIVLRSLEYPESERLHVLFEQDSTGSRRLASYPTFVDWREQADAFEGMAFIKGAPLNYRSAAGSGLLVGSFVSEDFFAVMGTSAARGRVLGAADFSAEAETAAVMSDRTWRSWFGARPDVIGSTMNVGGDVVTVVGIMPGPFQYPDWGVDTDLWLPIPKLPAPDFTSLMQRDFHADARVVARIRPDRELKAAESQMAVIAVRLAVEYPETNGPWTRNAILPLQGVIIGDFGLRLAVLGGVVGSLLLIACLNLGNLFLVQGLGRQREFAVRTALGAGRARLARQLGAESLVLCMLGGIVGVLGAERAVSWARGGGLSTLPRAGELSLDLAVLGMATAVTIGAAMLFTGVGIIALVSDGIMRSGDLRSGSGTARWKRLPAWAQSAQIALTFVLLVGSAVLTESLWLLGSVDPGFDPHRLFTIRINPPSPTYDTPEAATELYARLLGSVGDIAGVEGVALANHGPGSSAGAPTRAAIGRLPTGSQEDVAVSYRTISAGYFDLLSIPILSGREFTEDDLAGAAGPLIVNESLAQLWTVGAPLGGRLGVLKGASSREDFGEPLAGRVIGVVGNVVRTGGMDQEPPTVYVPYVHNPWDQVSIYVRAGDRAPADVLPRLREAVRAIDPAIPTDGQFIGATSVEAQRWDATYADRLNAALLGVFAAVGLLLATVGMYSVTAYSVTRQTRAFGVRLALGATGFRVVRTAVSRVAVTAAIGLLTGGVVATFLSALLGERLDILQRADAGVVIATATGLGLVVVLAGYIPARRAGQVDPVVALRAE